MGQMKISGKITDNLRAAVESARRFRTQVVHKETLDHWEALLEHARQRQRRGNPDPELSGWMSKLQSELARRQNVAETGSD
jgi:uncharacterized alpha-E superfamily protein